YHGYLESREFATAKDIISVKAKNGNLITVNKTEKVMDAVVKLNKAGISQVPVMDGENIVGSFTDTKILKMLIEDSSLKNKTVGEVMDNPFTFVGLDNTVDVLASLINKDNT